MSNRLNVHIKKQIVSRFTDFVFRSELDSLEAERLRLSNEIADFAIKPHKKAFESLPVEFVNIEVTLTVYFGSYRRYLQLGRLRRIPGVIRLPVKSKFELRLEQLENEIIQVEEERRVARSEVQALLNSVTTVKRLLVVWPEAAQFVPDPVVTNLLTVQVDGLNKLIRSVG